jgi:hypothetical protein
MRTAIALVGLVLLGWLADGQSHAPTERPVVRDARCCVIDSEEWGCGGAIHCAADCSLGQHRGQVVACSNADIF